MITMKDIAQAINALSHEYRMGRFQELRKAIHGLGHVKSNEIFTDQTIHDDYAFHSGGRKEIQYNIGFEEVEGESLFRFGLAFSLESSQTLTDVSVLAPKIQRFNDYISRNKFEFSDLRFWYFDHNVRSTTHPVKPIPENLIKNRIFLFIGRFCSTNEINVREVLFLFDRLLPLYEFVEGGLEPERSIDTKAKGFFFKAGCSDRADKTLGYFPSKSIEISLKHNVVQKGVFDSLAKQYGKTNVGVENDSGRGARIDLVVRKDDAYWYFEIKTHPDIRACLREAVAQLLEYSYWPGGHVAERMIVVSENILTPDAKMYLEDLRRRFTIPIYYQRYDAENGNLLEME